MEQPHSQDADEVSLAERQGARAKQGEKVMQNVEASETAARSNRRRPHFRFEDLEIWQLSKQMAVRFHKVAAVLEKNRYYRYAEQLRAAGMSLPNNIAEGSASPHVQEFRQFINIARRSLFEDASMLLVFESMEIMTAEELDSLLNECDVLSRKLTNFSRSLK